jgi:hypothetical protein
MHLRPEEVTTWFVDEIDSVKKKAYEIFAMPEGEILKGIYARLKEKLETYPPDQKFFSIPRMDLNTNTFWVRSENNRILIRAKYFVWAETCVIDKFYLSEERPADLEL